MKSHKMLKILLRIPLLCALTAPIYITSCSKTTSSGYIDVASYCDSTGTQDCADIIQGLIDNNPNKTLWFKDGTYLLSHQIQTSSNPTKSVSLELSRFAVLKATDYYKIHREKTEEWQDEWNYMVQLGADRYNDQEDVGNNYYFKGGYIDGNGIAAGIEISGGRETRVQSVTMKHVQNGLRVALGVNAGVSSDADIFDIDITCNNDRYSTGIIADGYDNSFTNIRVNRALHGVTCSGGGNSFRELHILCNGDFGDGNIFYPEGVGFSGGTNNLVDRCYCDNYRTAFECKGTLLVVNPIVFWYNSHGYDEIAFKGDDANRFSAMITNAILDFKTIEGQKNHIIANKESEVKQKRGAITNLIVNHTDYLADDSTIDYLKANEYLFGQIIIR